MIKITSLTLLLKQKKILNDFPKIFLLGRSNIGKSSFINFFVNQKVAKSSKRPGKTLFLNHYLVNESFYLIDTPGYGYMKSSLIRKNLVEEIMKNFFKQLKDDDFVILLLNIFDNIFEIDWYVLKNILKQTKHIFILISKSDKLNQSKKHQIKLVLEKKLSEISLEVAKNYAFFSLKNQELPKNLENQILSFICETPKI
ncbi:50S ribosome-binding GTPase [symbiont of Argiope bruennichi]|uniref:GTPase n=1 Tax=symbiont of Argiope bruennichi TaxID=2810479 RepID=UPI003DA5AF95